jgi:hypothetical protein
MNPENVATDYKRIAPTRAAVLAYVQDHPRATKREIERENNLLGSCSNALALLVREGLLRVEYDTHHGQRRGRWSAA